jgi:hypothetical protein
MREPLSPAGLRLVADAQGVDPTDADLERVGSFLAAFLPALEELERLLPADAEPAPFLPPAA